MCLCVCDFRLRLYLSVPSKTSSLQHCRHGHKDYSNNFLSAFFLKRKYLQIVMHKKQLLFCLLLLFFSLSRVCLLVCGCGLFASVFNRPQFEFHSFSLSFIRFCFCMCSIGILLFVAWRIPSQCK